MQKIPSWKTAVFITLALGLGLSSAQIAPRPATASLVDNTGRRVGSATFTPSPQGTIINLQVSSGLRAAEHGMHIHANGECAPGPDAQTGEIIPFGAAGGHFDPGQTMNHGGPDDPPTQAHAGDLGNIRASANGAGSAQITTTKLTATPGVQSVVGRSIVIHEKTDDLRTDPTGQSGGRIICGVILAENNGQLNSRIIIPGSDTFPEGIVYDSKRGIVYTGSASNGNLYRFTASSERAQLLALGGSPGRKAALGMKLDPQGRLMIATGSEGKVGIVDSTSGMTIKALETPPSPQAFINDLTQTPDGYVYVTDSFRPVIFRFRTNASGVTNIESWLNLQNTAIRYVPGLNLNGIVNTPDGRYLITVQTNTGRLYRIDTRSKAVREISLATRLTNGDGLVLNRRTLYVVRNATSRIEVLTLNSALTGATLGTPIAEPNLRFPTTAALIQGQMLVVNGQLDRQGEGAVLPFTISKLNLRPVQTR